MRAVKWRRVTATLLIAAAVAGCGAHESLEESAAPCLSKLGVYTNEGISGDVHILGRDMRSIPPPANLRRVTDLSFGSPGAGANSAQMFFHDSADAARAFARTWGRGRTRVNLESVIVFWTNPPSAKNRRVLTEQSAVVFFSSRPSARQHAEITDCLRS